MNQSLVNGKVVDANMRTHLLRFEKVPFVTLFKLTNLFFDSIVLLNDWIEDQFPNPELKKSIIKELYEDVITTRRTQTCH